jgi:hypothetical protein
MKTKMSHAALSLDLILNQRIPVHFIIPYYLKVNLILFSLLGQPNDRFQNVFTRQNPVFLVSLHPDVGTPSFCNL